VRIVSREAGDLGAEEDDCVLLARTPESVAEDAEKLAPLVGLRPQRDEGPRRRDAVRARGEGAFEERRRELGARGSE